MPQRGGDFIPQEGGDDIQPRAPEREIETPPSETERQPEASNPMGEQK
jgi:hypothetical protein